MTQRVEVVRNVEHDRDVHTVGGEIRQEEAHIENELVHNRDATERDHQLRGLLLRLEVARLAF